MENLKESLSTAEVMKLFDVGRNTLRLYEEKGLLAPPRRTEAGYREFTQHHLQTLKFILLAKNHGFTLAEIQGLLKLSESEPKCGKVSQEIKEKLTALDDEITLLNKKRNFLQSFATSCGNSQKDSLCNFVGEGFTNKACCS